MCICMAAILGEMNTRGEGVVGTDRPWDVRAEEASELSSRKNDRAANLSLTDLRVAHETRERQCGRGKAQGEGRVGQGLWAVDLPELGTTLAELSGGGGAKCVVPNSLENAARFPQFHSPGRACSFAQERMLEAA